MRRLSHKISDFCKRYAWLLFLVAGLSACSSPTAGGDRKSQDVITEAPANKLVTVEIKQMQFVPREVHVKQGDTILFINRDMVEHDVTEEANKSWSSSRLKTDSTWSLIATGSQNYYCSLHQVMKGKIILE